MTTERLLATHVARRLLWAAVGWGSVFGSVVCSSALAYSSAYPTPAARQQLARGFGADRGIAALLGPARHLDTVAGFTAWRSLAVLAIVGAVWALLASTRQLRGEEDAGRWELVTAAPTTRPRSTAAVMIGLAAAAMVFWATVAVFVLAITGTAGISITAALFFSVALVAPVVLFLAVGAFTSQLATTRRQAAAVAGMALGVAYGIRLVADSAATLQWARWLSPLGWVENLRPLTGTRPLALAPIVALAVLLGGGAVGLAAVRDLGGGVLAASDHAEPRLTLLGGPLGLAVRLARPAAVGWISAIAVTGFVIGLVAKSAGTAALQSSSIRRIIARLGGRGAGASAYVGLAFLIVATLVALAAAGQATATREEESEGRLDNLLVAPVGRGQWLAARFGIGIGVVALASLAGGALAWIGAATQDTGLGLPRMLAAGVNTIPVAVLVLGIGIAAFGVAPRSTARVTYAVVAWSLLVEMVGSVVKANRWLLDASLFHHVAPAPSVPPRWDAAAVMFGLGLVAAAVGAVAFARRDVTSS